MVNKNKRLIVRLSALVLILLLALLMFMVGKQHTILIDNKNIEIEGQSYSAFSLVEVQIDKTENLELAKRDRDQALVTGQSHKVKVLYNDKDWNEIVIERKFTVPHGVEMLVFSVPAFVANPDDSSIYITPFERKKVE